MSIVCDRTVPEASSISCSNETLSSGSPRAGGSSAGNGVTRRRLVLGVSVARSLATTVGNNAKGLLGVGLLIQG